MMNKITNIERFIVDGGGRVGRCQVGGRNPGGWPRAARLVALVLAAAIGWPSLASGQTTSLFHHPQSAASVRPAPTPWGEPGAIDAQGLPQAMMPTARRPATNLATASWTYQPAPPMRVFHKNDIITIRVDEIARMLAEGEAEKRRSSLYTAVLTDWIQISKGRLRPDPQEDGEPSVGGASNDRFRNESSVESRESVSFNIAATVVDIRPNGNLVLEARKSIRVNDNVWESSLTGICRAVDVGPDNVVLSKDLLDLEVHKQDQGQLRDGYRRGWFTRWLDRLQPF